MFGTKKLRCIPLAFKAWAIVCRARHHGWRSRTMQYGPWVHVWRYSNVCPEVSNGFFLNMATGQITNHVPKVAA